MPSDAINSRPHRDCDTGTYCPGLVGGPHLAHAVDDLVQHVAGISGEAGGHLQLADPALGIVHAHLMHIQNS